MLTTQQVMWALLGILIGTVAGFVVGEMVIASTAEKRRRPVFRRLAAAIVGAVTGHIIVQTIQLALLLQRVDVVLNKTSPFEQASRSIARQTAWPRQLYEESLRDLSYRLTLIGAGEMLVPREEVFNVWRRAYELAPRGVTISATNLVSEADWGFFGPEGGGRQIQQDAIRRGVVVRRIMLLDPEDPQHREGLLRLANFNVEVGVQVRQLSVDWLETPAFQGWLRQLGSQDLVLFGDDLLLITYVHPKTKSIVRSELTTKPEKIVIARAFLERMWSDAKPIPTTDVANVVTPGASNRQ